MSLKLQYREVTEVDRNFKEIWFWPGFAAQNAVSQLTSAIASNQLERKLNRGFRCECGFYYYPPLAIPQNWVPYFLGAFCP